VTRNRRFASLSSLRNLGGVRPLSLSRRSNGIAADGASRACDPRRCGGLSEWPRPLMDPGRQTLGASRFSKLLAHLALLKRARPSAVLGADYLLQRHAADPYRNRLARQPPRVGFGVPESWHPAG
jgi:hypothetical protein